MKIKIVDTNRHTNLASGYGQIAANLAARLHGLGHDVYFDVVNTCGDALLDSLARKVLDHTPDTICLWTKPPAYVDTPEFDPKQKNIFYTMHEREIFDGYKEHWPQLLNKCTAVITPTEWNKNVFIKNGVTVPVHVCPIGVNTGIFNPFHEFKFGVLTVHEAFASEGSRENWRETLEAFNEMFSERKDAYLTIKSWNVKPEAQKQVLVKYPDLEVRVVTSTFEAKDMAELYRNHQVFIKNSNREGWSIPLTEAQVCGMPVIVRDWPVLRENVKTVNVKWFKKKDQLKFLLAEAYQGWKKTLTDVNAFSWRWPVEKLVQILEQYV